MKRSFIFLTVLAVAAMLLAGCAPSGTPSPTAGQTTPSPAPTPGSTTQPPIPGPSTGTIKVLVTDAPAYDVSKVEVTVSEVEVHKAGDDGESGGWITLAIQEQTFDLLALQDGLTLLLAQGEVESGTYTQLRMTVFDVKVDYNGVTDKEAIVPSDKLKFVRPFTLEAGGEITLIVDIDAADSVVFTGADKDGVKVLFKPVVKLSVSEKGKPAKLEATLDTTGEAEAELSTEIKHTGRDSVHLKTTGTEEPGDEARIVIPLPEGTTLGKIESISWWAYLVGGYIPHVDLVLDYDEDASRDDVLVAEAAHQNDNDATTWKDSYKGEDVGWIETFEGASGVYTSWAMSGNCGDVKCMNGETAVWMVAANDPNFGLDTLTNFQTTTGKTDGSITINEETAVLALEIEIDNWIYQSEAYVDDIEVIIDGVTYKVHL